MSQIVAGRHQRRDLLCRADRDSRPFPSISGSKTFTGTGGLDVIDVNGNVDFEKGDTLTINGNASDQFVINIDASSGEDLQFNGGSSIVLERHLRQPGSSST